VAVMVIYMTFCTGRLDK